MASELTLIDRTLGGDRDAFADLISGYLGLVHGIILNKVRRPDEVEDLVQDVFVKAYQELPRLRDRDKFGPWLGRIALNRAQAWLRQRQSHRTTVTDDPMLLEKVDHETPDDLLEKSEKDAIVWEALDQLRPEYRQILLLFHFENCPQQDIARFLSISVPTVKWRLMRARIALKRRVEDVVRAGPTEARRQRQKERIAAAVPVLAMVSQKSVWRPPPAMLLILRRGLAIGGALTFGVAGSLAYESQVQSAEAEVPGKRYSRVSVRLADPTAVGTVQPTAVAARSGQTDSMQDGTVLLPPCSSGRVRRR
ncbi:MAG: sigma-70 family RNA polymerase sigma factor [Gemmatimonadetes bacterium]|jgi:RNA polymerase sigma-70 factor, ECF subfamily|nr:sigma-70 family RNA polymerase sigma factor [Gemmatimonadota bacterium]